MDKINPPKGRFSVIPLPKGKVIIDYAHTPDALENICSEIKKAFPESKLTVVFGCGGDRDRGKRPLMGKIVCRYADRTIVTSDNPRSEDPERIIDEIVAGLNKPHYREADRKRAIWHALKSMEDDEVVLIAGKGHEDYQEIKGERHPFSDFEVVEDFIKAGERND